MPNPSVSVRKNQIKMSVMQVTYWCSVAALSAFSVGLARDRNLSAALIGVMAALYKLAAVFGQFFWGGLCDKTGGNKKIFAAANGITILASLGFYFFPGNYSMLLFYALLGFVQVPAASVLDTWVITYMTRKGSSSYGPIRSMGSLGYAVFIFFYGMMIAKYGYAVMPWFFTVFSVLTILAAKTVPDAKTVNERKKKMNLSEIAELFKNRTYFFLLLILFFDGMACFSFGQMKILVWEAMHASIAFQGYDGFAGAIAQVPAMFIASQMIRFDAKKRLIAGVFLDMSMLIICYFAKTPQLIIAGSVISGFGYGLLLPAMRQIILKESPDTLRTTAQGLGDAIYGNFSSMIGCVLAGAIIDALGIKAMILCCIGTEFAAVILAVLFAAGSVKPQKPAL